MFYPLIVNLVLKGIEPSEMATPRALYIYQKLRFGLVQVMPGELFNEITSTLLVPSVRSVGPLTLLCFVFSYLSFMRREIRSR